MGLISSLFVHKVVNVASANDAEKSTRRRALLESVNLEPDGPVDPKIMIADTDYYGLPPRYQESRHA